jgi:hypothetical protein
VARWIGFFLLNIFLISRCFAQESSYHVFGGKMRLSALKHADQLLDMITERQARSYVLVSPTRMQFYTNDLPSLIAFASSYGYFSLHPLIAHVSNDQDDLDRVLSLFEDFAEASVDDRFASFAILELLAKVLAYRDLKEGQLVNIPIAEGKHYSMVAFTVDHVFNLWKGMPAFGLIPDKKGAPSILLFRGTDLALHSKRGWASVLSDIDVSGPGFSTFQRAQKEIHDWLEKAAGENKKARAIGFSLGGSLAAYTFLYENPLLSEEGSIAFNAPGVSESVLEEWNRLPEHTRAQFAHYVNRGDIISKIGHLLGPAFELSTDLALKPIAAHTVLMSSQPRFTLSAIDTAKENAKRYHFEKNE